ncbi:hypothetical protein [Tahibacter harae]|uniref:ELWxxDGT repeat protein n=1 Tax=Tahibacter harae TaxID=2963937 RepID=A0ABT1QZ49_9GAMM|nr:hypothetical protein [Tahibacter harae]MCQ4167533.1 hypothetical protein [Tahibacter harae]
MPQHRSFRRLSVSLLLAGLCGLGGVQAAQLSEGFNLDGSTLPSTTLPPGWIARNQSVAAGSGINANCFYLTNRGGVGTGDNAWLPLEGAGMAYATLACTPGVGAMNGFLISPELSQLANGVQISFQTRGDTLTGPLRPDRLQLLLCLGATCGDAGSSGSTPQDVGQFDRLLLDLNPEQASGVFPLSWTAQSVTLAGLPPGVHSGRIAFRFLAPNGGPSGNQGSRVGVDSVVVGDPPPEPTGGWSNDPATTFAIADRGGEETQAKILPRADGGFFVSWFDNTDGGYDLRLQRLDAQGRELWPHNGILVADRSFQYTTDYGFSVDAAGNALLSYQCCTQMAADERIVVSKVAPDGTLLWTDGRIPVSTLGEGEQISYVTTTSDGNAVVVWMNDSGAARAQKLSPVGQPLWGAEGISLPGPAGGKLIADVIASTNGDAIVSWSNQAGSTRILRAQKLAAADGAVLWGNDGVRLSDTGNLGAGYFPKMIADGSGGAVFAFTDFIGLASSARVQHLDAAGTRLLGAEGVLLTTNTSRGHYLPVASYDAASGDIFALWIDSQIISPNAYDGLYTQRVNSAGQRLWGEEGRELVPMTVSTDGSQALSQTVALPAPGGFLAAWVTGNTSAMSNPITVQRLAADGALVWNQAVRLKAAATRTSRLAATTGSAGYAAFTWSDAPDNTVANQDVHGQNLQYNGQLGDTLFRDGFQN